MTPLRGLNSLIFTHSIKTYELLQCSKYPSLAILRTQNNFQKWSLSMSLQIDLEPYGIYEYFSNIFFAQVHLQTVSVLQAAVIHLNLNLSSNGSKKIHENE